LTAALALAVAAVNFAAGTWGAWRWYRVDDAQGFWPALRTAQTAAGLYAVYGGMLVALGRGPDNSLFLLYALLPVAVNVVAEQLRIASAQTVLDARDLESAAALGERPAAEQRSVVRQILRRELGVMAAAALVVAFLALRAAGTV
jgi:Ni/Fe-hydrogenase subunit HybB-like protein